MFEVCLVSMPFAAIERPSIALGLLQAILDREGLRTTVLYANLDFAGDIGAAAYDLWERALGDLAFSPAAFPGFVPPAGGCTAMLRRAARRLRLYAAQAGLPEGEQPFLEAARAVRARAVEHVDHAARAALATGARIVGCSSTFWQHTAALALLRRVREIDESVITLMGGANCETVMGRATHRNFPWVDYVVSGEADDLIATLCATLLESGGREAAVEDLPPGVFGPVHRRTGYPAGPGQEGVPRASCRSVAELPTPNYDDYFRALGASPIRDEILPGLLVETARGCWYGQTRQCLFCGISEGGMVYRSKPAERVLGELAELEGRYGLSRLEVVDNILDMAYFKTVLPHLAARRGERRIFWETKANLKRHDVELLARAGVLWVQPGIESLDTRALKLMQKGVQAWQNVQLLKWCREFGVRLAWNFLWGFPGEEDGWYQDMAAWIPWVQHLQSPRGIVQLRYDRYSVYQVRPEAYGLKLKPASFMSLTYPLPAAELTDLTYYFDLDEGANGRQVRQPERPGLQSFQRAVTAWQQRFWSGLPPVLTMEDDGGALHLLDSREVAEESRTVLRGLARAIYLCCDEGPLRGSLPGILARSHGLTATAEGIAEVLADLRRRRLLLELDGHLVSLAVRGPLPPLPSSEEFPGGVVRRPQRQTARK